MVNKDEYTSIGLSLAYKRNGGMMADVKVADPEQSCAGCRCVSVSYGLPHLHRGLGL